MPDALYQQAILKHAKAAIGAGRLENATAEATVDNPALRRPRHRQPDPG